MNDLHDPSYQVRRALWIAYGVLAIGLVVFFIAVVLIGQYRSTGLNPQPPAKASPRASATPSASPSTSPGSPAPAGIAARRRKGSSAGTGRLTSTGFAPGEPPGDIEDDSQASADASNAGGGSNAGGPSAGLLPWPALPVPHQRAGSADAPAAVAIVS